jgi:hypothetical protein
VDCSRCSFQRSLMLLVVVVVVVVGVGVFRGVINFAALVIIIVAFIIIIIFVVGYVYRAAQLPRGCN